MDIKKACRSNKPIMKASRHLQLGVAGGRISPTHADQSPSPSAANVRREIDMLKQRLDRRNIKVSKVAEAWVNFVARFFFWFFVICLFFFIIFPLNRFFFRSSYELSRNLLHNRLIGYFEQYVEYDPVFTQPELGNPWVTDSPEMWEQEKLAWVINLTFFSSSFQSWKFVVLWWFYFLVKKYRSGGSSGGLLACRNYFKIPLDVNSSYDFLTRNSVAKISSEHFFFFNSRIKQSRIFRILFEKNIKCQIFLSDWEKSSKKSITLDF